MCNTRAITIPRLFTPGTHERVVVCTLRFVVVVVVDACGKEMNHHVRTCEYVSYALAIRGKGMRNDAQWFVLIGHMCASVRSFG